MDATLLAILVILVFATALALVQRYRRDRCLRSFDGFHVTLAEDGGDLVWGRAGVYASGLEMTYAAPVEAPGGHREGSFLFYKEQYEALGALYRYPEGLSAAEQARRAEAIQATARPGVGRRLRRRLRNWAGMVRDALVQAVGVVIGAAQARRPGGAVLQQGGEGVKALSKEMAGQAGAAYDPLLERHLFRQVVVEVASKDGTTRSFCGWLKDYTSEFLEVVDAFANEAGAARPVRRYGPGDADAPATIRAEGGTLAATNESAHLLYVASASEASGNEKECWQRALGCVLPPGATADLPLPPSVAAEDARLALGAPERVDLVVPRRRAVVRHAADGSETRRPATSTGVMAEVAERGEPPSPADANGAPPAATEAQP